MSKILVTGAAGGLGGRIVEFLQHRVPAGNIVALARDPAKLSAFAKKGVEVGVATNRVSATGIAMRAAQSAGEGKHAAITVPTRNSDSG